MWIGFDRDALDTGGGLTLTYFQHIFGQISQGNPGH